MRTITNRAAGAAADKTASEGSPGGNGQSADRWPAERPGGLRPSLTSGVSIEAARAGDHVSVFHLLQHVFHAPSAMEYQAVQDHPTYEPADRLLFRQGQRLLGHVHTAHRVMRFASLQLPVAEVQDLCVPAEFRGKGIGSGLLEAAEEKIVDEGALLGLLRTDSPDFFARRGWVVCGRHSYSTATARDILSRLASLAPAATSPLAPKERPLNIRLWRQVEQDALCQLYEQNIDAAHGPTVRNHAYWRWLVSRHAYDRIYVAIEGSDKLEFEECASRIAGYAVVRNGRILELMASPRHETAGTQLLARACGDAIERDELTVRLDGPPNHPLHQEMVAAGGSHIYRESDGADVFMAKLFDPLQLVEQLRGEIFARAKASDLSLPTDLGLLVDGDKHQLLLTRRSAKLAGGKIGRSYLSADKHDLTRLLLGHATAEEEEAAGRLEASTRVALETANILFPRLPLWLPPLDNLPAE